MPKHRCAYCKEFQPCPCAKMQKVVMDNLYFKHPKPLLKPKKVKDTTDE